LYAFVGVRDISVRAPEPNNFGVSDLMSGDGPQRHKVSFHMQLVDTQVLEEFGEAPGFKVEFHGDGGEIVSVKLRAGDDLNRLNAAEKARAVLVQLACFQMRTAQSAYAHKYEAQSNGDFDESSPSESPAVASLSQTENGIGKSAAEEKLEEGLNALFPASEPASVTARSIRRDRTERI
jgi:hypothetical protein